MTVAATSACLIRVRGVVQGVGFRPFVFRLAREHALAGWVLNGTEGVEIHLEGADDRLDAFVRSLRADAPPAAAITAVDVEATRVTGMRVFEIRQSRRPGAPTTRIAPDLGICDRCVAELFDPGDARYEYPYINCTDCGPRYSIVLDLPYDRAATTMRAWPMDERCEREYHDPLSRRFHAQPTACPACGPQYEWRTAADRLRRGEIVAIKGIGGYHLACDARSAGAVATLRQRKYRKDKPFAVMVRDLAAARLLANVSPQAAALLTSPARPIVLVSAIAALPGVAPGNDAIGIMLPYTPVQHLLFAAEAPPAIVLTSANRSSEPIAYRDEEAREQLAGIADAFLVGERPIARRVEDSVVRVGPSGPVILRRSRGYAPGAVATLPVSYPLLALGADLKNTVTLVVDGQAFVSQHIGDLEHYAAFAAFRETIGDLLRMYDVRQQDLVVVRDSHPQYRSSQWAPSAPSVQHHRAHIASVLAEREAWDTRVLGVALDGTGYGDDGTIWGGEIFTGSIAQGFGRVAHLRTAALPGGDAAAQHPEQAAAGFLQHLDGLPDLEAAPFCFSTRYRNAVKLCTSRTRTFDTTSAGRLFDTVAALLGFTRPVTFEGQAAIWLEQRARRSGPIAAYESRDLDYRPLLQAVIRDRLNGRPVEEIARAFHAGFAMGLGDTIVALSVRHGLDTVVASGGVLQNELLVQDLGSQLDAAKLAFWTNHAVPPNDGGISLGQAALAAFGQCTSSPSR
jgi:hydrogenase maturation protein HypF